MRLLARGRSVRLTGPSGSGRTALLDAVAADCADLAPDGVVRLTGYHRTAADLLHELFDAVYSAPLYRPDRDELLALVREIGAVVVLDDLEFGGAALDELLDATPECAFLIGATPDVPAPVRRRAASRRSSSPASTAAGGLELLERAVDRVLTEEEANWAGDLWFESEGLPLRFVQAGALLRQRDELRAGADAVDEFGVFEDARRGRRALRHRRRGTTYRCPRLGEGAAPAPLLASRLSASARETLRFAVALGGEVPHQAHLPALVGDTHADAALGELLGCALVSPVGSRYRLAAGVLAQLEAAGYAEGAARAGRCTAAQHYAWWAGHPSVTPERVVRRGGRRARRLDALGGPVPRRRRRGGQESAAVLLARTRRARLRGRAALERLGEGAAGPAPEAARLAGEVAEEAYFHHELGVLALCGGQLDRARAELEAVHRPARRRSPTSAARWRAAGRSPWSPTAPATPRARSGPGSTAGEEVPDARYEESASPPGGVPAVFGPRATRRSSRRPAVPVRLPDRPLRGRRLAPTVIASRSGGGGAHRARRPAARGRARRNLVAVGAGALLAAVLGTVVTLGATSDPNDAPSDQVGVNPSASEGDATTTAWARTGRQRRQRQQRRHRYGHQPADRPGPRRHDAAPRTTRRRPRTARSRRTTRRGTKTPRRQPHRRAHVHADHARRRRRRAPTRRRPTSPSTTPADPTDAHAFGRREPTEPSDGAVDASDTSASASGRPPAPSDRDGERAGGRRRRRPAHRRRRPVRRR